MLAYGMSHQGLVRANNEDSFFWDSSGLLIVADGMGGHAGGEEASKLAVKAVVDHLSSVTVNIEEMTREAIVLANKTVLDRAAENPQLAGMGTTLTMVKVLPDFLITGHIGDSSAYIIDANGVRCLTADHSVSGQLLSAGKISQEEAVNHPQRHVLTRALGVSDEVEVEVLKYPWSTGQYLLLCTDGLILPQEQIAQVVRSGIDVEAKVREMVELVLKQGAPDNVTLVLAQL